MPPVTLKETDMEYTQEEMDAMPEEERNAILEEAEANKDDDADDGDDSKEEEAGKADEKQQAKDADDDKDGGDDEKASDKEEEQQAAASDDDKTGDTDKEGDTEVDGDDNQGEQASQEMRAPFAPQLNVEVPENLQEQLDELDEQFDQGDLSIKEYNEKRDALIATKIKADIANDLNSQTSEQMWEHSTDVFFSIKGNEHYRDNPVLFNAIDGALKELYKDEENADKSHFWFLTEAKKMVDETMGFQSPAGNEDENSTQGKGKTGQDNKNDKGDNKKNVKPRNAEDQPKTLGDIPNADEAEDTNNEFTHLDKLEGVELEAAIANMPPDKQDRYLQAKG